MHDIVVLVLSVIFFTYYLVTKVILMVFVATLVCMYVVMAAVVQAIYDVSIKVLCI
jgi:hypothetical protein